MATRPYAYLTDEELVRLWLAGDGDDDVLAAEMALREIDF